MGACRAAGGVGLAGAVGCCGCRGAGLAGTGFAAGEGLAGRFPFCCFCSDSGAACCASRRLVSFVGEPVAIPAPKAVRTVVASSKRFSVVMRYLVSGNLKVREIVSAPAG